MVASFRERRTYRRGRLTSQSAEGLTRGKDGKLGIRLFASSLGLLLIVQRYADSLGSLGVGELSYASAANSSGFRIYLEADEGSPLANRGDARRARTREWIAHQVTRFGRHGDDLSHWFERLLPRMQILLRFLRRRDRVAHPMLGFVRPFGEHKHRTVHSENFLVMNPRWMGRLNDRQLPHPLQFTA